MSVLYLWRRVGNGKRSHAFYVRTDLSVSLIAICGVGPKGDYLGLPECERCLQLTFRDKAAA